MIIMAKAANHPRRAARENVLKALYAEQYSDGEAPSIILNRISDDGIDNDNKQDYISSLFNCVLEHKALVDKLIKNHLQNWEFNRIAQLDRALLRMGICEILYMQDIPPKVTITEMVEIAKVYSTEESSGFINGVLDAILQDFKKDKRN